MKTYYFYLTENYDVKAAIKEYEEELLLGVLELELDDLLPIHNLMQNFVTAILDKVRTDQLSKINSNYVKGLN